MLIKSEYSEAELVKLLKSKDQHAYNFLYNNYASALFGIIHKVIGQREEATDILQDVFIKIWRNIESYDVSKGRLFTWMLNIARNTSIDFLRSGQSQKDKKTNNIESGMSLPGEKLVTYIHTDHMGLKNVIAHLKEEHKLLIDLIYFKGYTQEEIAKELNIPLGTVKTRIRNALIQLKNILK